MQDIYRITIDCHLADRWSERFSGLSIDRRDDGTTVLTGQIEDQAALHGLLAQIRDLSIDLVSVEKTDQKGRGRPP